MTPDELMARARARRHRDYWQRRDRMLLVVLVSRALGGTATVDELAGPPPED